MILKDNISIKQIWHILEQVSDPEIPVVSITDLGIVRDVILSPSMSVSPSSPVQKGQVIEVIITPTYSGCPAMDVIVMNMKIAFLENGFQNVKVTRQLSPAWTTDWMTETGKNKLKSYGIAAPAAKSNGRLFLEDIKIECPQCLSKNTRLLSQFGSTACKALYQCIDCKEPFDYFKCH